MDLAQSRCSKFLRLIPANTVEARIDASDGQGFAVRRGAKRIRHIQMLTQDGKVNITKIPVLRTEPILEARFKKCWSSALVTFGKVDQELRCVQKCKKSRANILVFSVWTTQLPLKHSRSQSRLNTGEPIDAQVEYLFVDGHKITVRWRTLTMRNGGSAKVQRPWCHRTAEGPPKRNCDPNTQLNLLLNDMC